MNLDWESVKSFAVAIAITLGSVAIILGIAIGANKNHRTTKEVFKETFMTACMKVEQNQEICDYEYLKTLKH